jgi:hypothetical protein
MKCRLIPEAQSQEFSRRASLNRRVRVRTGQLPGDFFKGRRSQSGTRPSSASRSINEPSTPSFGRRSGGLVQEERVLVRRRRSEVLEIFRGRSKRYNGSLDGR